MDDAHVSSSRRDFHTQRICSGRGATQDADRPGWISIGDGVQQAHGSIEGQAFVWAAGVGIE